MFFCFSLFADRGYLVYDQFGETVKLEYNSQDILLKNEDSVKSEE